VKGRITISHSLVLFPADTRDLSGEQREVPAGTYRVEAVDERGKVRWLKIEGENWGNAAECWDAVKSGGEPRPLLRTRNLILAMVAGLLSLILIKNSCIVARDSGDTHTNGGPSTVLKAVIEQYTEGKIQTRWYRNRSSYDSEYRAGWYTIAEIAGGKRLLHEVNHPQIVQIHRDALIVLLVISIFVQIPRSVRGFLRILVPIVIWPMPQMPISNPTLDTPFFFFFPLLVIACIVLLWANPMVDEKPSRLHQIQDMLAWVLPAGYNLLIFLIIKPF
jgi:hypothetical protein